MRIFSITPVLPTSENREYAIVVMVSMFVALEEPDSADEAKASVDLIRVRAGMNSTKNEGDLPASNLRGSATAPEHSPLVNIVGVQVALGPLRRDLLPEYTRWRNDFTVARTLEFIPGPFTAEEREGWFAQASVDTTTIRFTVYESTTWRAIGITS